MALLMKDWLSCFVHKEFGAALDWLEKGASSGQKNVKYSGDGGNLRVRRRNPNGNKRLRILNFSSFEDPIKAHLSDSLTSIEVIFAKIAVDAYRENQGTRLTDNPRGSVVHLTDFELVLSPYGGDHERVTLLIKEFTIVGSCGESPWGSPSPIDSRTGIKELIDRLSHIEADQSQEDAQSESSDPSQFGSQVGDDDHSERQRSYNAESLSSVATQNLFLTQAPVQPNLRHIEHESLNLGNGPQDNCDEGNATAQKMPEAVNIDRSADLYKILAEKQAMPKRQSPEPHTSTHGAIPRNHHHATSERDNDRMLKSGALPANDPPLSGLAQSYNEHAKQPEFLSAREDNLNQAAPETALETESSSDVISKPQDLSELKSGTTDEDRIIHDNSDPNHSKSITVLDPWEGMSHIPTSDVRISREQLKLLENKYSWIPPETGNPTPAANIPYSILQSLNDLADNGDLGPSTGNSSNANDSNLDVDEDSLLPTPSQLEQPEATPEDSDHPVSDSEWPRSEENIAEEDHLPADSSPNGDSGSEEGKEMPMDTQTYQGTPAGHVVLLEKDSSMEVPPRKRPRASKSPGSPPTRSNLPDFAIQESDVIIEQAPARAIIADKTLPDSAVSQEAIAPASEIDGYQDGQDTSLKSIQPSIDDFHVSMEMHEPNYKDLLEDKSAHLPSNDLNSDEDIDIEVILPHAYGEPIREPTLPSSSADQESGSITTFAPPATIQRKPSLLQVERTPYDNVRVKTDLFNSQEGSENSSDHLGMKRSDTVLDSVHAPKSTTDLIPGTFVTPSGSKRRKSIPIAMTENGHQILHETMESNRHTETSDQTSKGAGIPTSSVQSLVPTQSSSNDTEESIEINILTQDGQGIHTTGIESETGRYFNDSSPRRKRASVTNEWAQNGARKQRKHYKPPTSFHFSQEDRQTIDVADLAHQQRREFLSSLPARDVSENHRKTEQSRDIGPAEESNTSKVRAPLANLDPGSLSIPSNIFYEYKCAYPEYDSDLNNFLSLCNKIKQLTNQGRLADHSVWDDFVGRYKPDYPKYLMECVEKGKDPLTYENYYLRVVERPRFTKKIITWDRLDEAIVLSEGHMDREKRELPHGSSHDPTVASAPEVHSSISVSPKLSTPLPARPEIFSKGRGTPASLDRSNGGAGARNKLESERSHNPPERASPSIKRRGRRSIPWAIESESKSSPNAKASSKPRLAVSPLGRMAPKLSTSGATSPSVRSETRTISRRDGLADSKPPSLKPPSETLQPSPSVGEKKPPIPQSRWWESPDTPYKEFVRSYANLKGVQGALGTVDSQGMLRPPLKRINVLDWHLP